MTDLGLYNGKCLSLWQARRRQNRAREHIAAGTFEIK